MISEMLAGVVDEIMNEHPEILEYPEAARKRLFALLDEIDAVAQELEEVAK
jgi:hypothetical protein